MNMEMQNNQETIKQPSMEAINNIVNKLPTSEAEKAGKNLAPAYDGFKKGIQEQNEAKDKKESTDLLKNFKNKNLVRNPIVKEALENPEDSEKIKKMQQELGYDENKKNYYPEEHRNDMKGPDGKMKEPDGMAGPFTIKAIENMIADEQNTEAKKNTENKETIDKTKISSIKEKVIQISQMNDKIIHHTTEKEGLAYDYIGKNIGKYEIKIIEGKEESEQIKVKWNDGDVTNYLSFKKENNGEYTISTDTWSYNKQEGFKEFQNINDFMTETMILRPRIDNKPEDTKIYHKKMDNNSINKEINMILNNLNIITNQKDNAQVQ